MGEVLNTPFLGESQWPGDMLSWTLHVDCDGYFLQEHSEGPCNPLGAGMIS